MSSVCRQEVISQIALVATPFIRGNPTAECVDGNAHVVSLRNNVEKSENPIRINCQDKNAMKSVMRTIERVVTQDKRKRIVTLKPKGTKSDYNGCRDVIGNEQTVSGLQMASKAFTIICDVELGKPNMLPENPGSDPVRANDGIVGIGIGKKQRTPCNEVYRGSKICLNPKGCRITSGVPLYEWRQTMNVRCSTTLKSERLTDAQCVNRLQTGIIKATIEMITAARYRKGYGRLEPYAVKVARTVLRRGRASNRSSLFGGCHI